MILEGIVTTQSATGEINIAPMGPIVDADMRHGILHSVFDVAPNKGLSSLILDKTELEDVLQVSPLAQVDVLTKGPTVRNPLHLLAQPQLEPAIPGGVQSLPTQGFGSTCVLDADDVATALAKRCGEGARSGGQRAADFAIGQCIDRNTRKPFAKYFRPGQTGDRPVDGGQQFRGPDSSVAVAVDEIERARIELDAACRTGQRDPEFLVERGEGQKVVGTIEANLIEAASAEESPGMSSVGHGFSTRSSARKGMLNDSGTGRRFQLGEQYHRLLTAVAAELGSGPETGATGRTLGGIEQQTKHACRQMAADRAGGFVEGTDRGRDATGTATHAALHRRESMMRWGVRRNWLKSSASRIPWR